MLKPTWMRLACRKPPVTRRYHSPSAIAGPKTAPSWTSCDDSMPRKPTPWAISATKMSTLSATSTVVAIATSPCARATRTRAAGVGALAPPPRAHSGQRTPTAAWVMQEVQIGRSQFEHDRSVSRSGWR